MIWGSPSRIFDDLGSMLVDFWAIRGRCSKIGDDFGVDVRVFFMIPVRFSKCFDEQRHPRDETVHPQCS